MHCMRSSCSSIFLSVPLHQREMLYVPLFIQNRQVWGSHWQWLQPLWANHLLGRSIWLFSSSYAIIRLNFSHLPLDNGYWCFNLLAFWFWELLCVSPMLYECFNCCFTYFHCVLLQMLCGRQGSLCMSEKNQTLERLRQSASLFTNTIIPKNDLLLAQPIEVLISSFYHFHGLHNSTVMEVGC